MAITVRKLIAILGVKADDAAVRRFDGAMVHAKGTMDDTVSTTNRLGQSIKGLVAGFLGFEAIRRVVTGIVDANVVFQRLQAQLVTVEGDAQKAAAAFELIQEFASTTPFEIDNVTAAFIRLKNVGLDASADSMRALGDIAAANNLTIDELAQTVQSATTGEFEPLKKLGIVGKIAKPGGKEVEFLFRGVKTTVKRDALAIQKFLVDIGKTNFAGGMERQMNTLGGRFSNLKDAIFQLFVQIGEAGLSDAILELTTVIIGATQGSGDLARALGSVLGNSVKRITRAFKFMMRHAEQVKLVLVAITSLLSAKLILGFVSALGPMIAALRSLSVAATLPAIKLIAIAAAIAAIVLIGQDLLVFLSGGDSLIGRFLKKFEGSDGPMGAIADSLRTMVDAVRDMIPTFMSLFADLKQTGIASLKILAQLFTELLPVVVAFWSMMMRNSAAVVPLVIKLFAEVGKVLAAVFAEAAPLIQELMAVLQDLVKELGPELIGAIKLLGPVIVFMARLFVRWIKTLVRGVKIIGKVFKGLSKTLKRIFGFIGRLASLVAHEIELEWDDLASALKGAWFDVRDTVSEVLDDIKDFMRPFTDEVVEIWKAHLEQPLTDMFDRISSVASGILDTVIDSMTKAFDRVASAIGDVVEGVKELLGLTTETAKQGPQRGALATAASATGVDIAGVAAPGVGFGGARTGEAAAASSVGLTSNINVASMAVNVQGSTNMGPGQLRQATAKGTSQAMARVNRETQRSFSAGEP
jgi:hypothetical protein